MRHDECSFIYHELYCEVKLSVTPDFWSVRWVSFHRSATPENRRDNKQKLRNKGFSFLIWVKRRNIKFTWLHSPRHQPCVDHCRRNPPREFVTRSASVEMKRSRTVDRVQVTHRRKKLFFTLKDSQFSATLGCLKTHCKVSFILLCHNIS